MRAFLLIFVVFLAAPVQAQNLPDYSEVYVNDFANILPDAEEQAIRSDLQELKRERDIEFTVVTIGSMTDYGHDGPIEPFATALFNHWGVGDAVRNDGVMMLIAVQDRHMRIEVGSGYGTRMNGPMKEIIDDVILPRFKRDDYVTGIDYGVDHVIHEVSGSWPGEFNATGAERAIGSARRGINALGNWIYALLVPAIGALGMLFRRIRRYRPRYCPNDGARLVLLDEEADDAYLSQGQIAEEQLGSVDYDIWHCPDCDHVTVENYKAWFNKFQICRACGHRTVQSTTIILESATTTSTGRKRVVLNCRNCGDESSAIFTTPLKSTNSSSGGGSFGGGSSSGGGASGSW
ncbi:MAG: TPM domain-containing protein [Thalassovita sp.]